MTPPGWKATEPFDGNVWLLRDPEVKGGYVIGIQTHAALPMLKDATVENFRTARQVLNRETYIDMCRMSFEDWIARNHGKKS